MGHTVGGDRFAMTSATDAVADIVRAIEPFDSVERQHIARTLDWIESTEDIYRRVKPATPSPHLVSYVVMVDPENRGVYLGTHLKSGLSLPMGGHVDPGEHPLATARREAGEELGIEAAFGVVGEDPLFLTVQTTIGRDSGHVDVSLWYVITGDRHREYPLDATEFDGGRWWDIDQRAIPDSDPHFDRFLDKLAARLPARARR